MTIENMVNGAPQVIRDAMAKKHAAIKRLDRAQKQMSLWSRESSSANNDLNDANQEFVDLMHRWDLVSPTIPDPKEEL